MNKLLNRALELLYPPKCALCRKLLERSERGICKACTGKLPEHAGILRPGEHFSQSVSAFRYDGAIRESLLRMKFGGCPNYAEFYGEQIARCVREQFDGRWDLISWVPISRKRRVGRGYDQAKLLAQAAARALGTQPVPTLRKIRDNKRQSRIADFKQRRKNVEGVYRAREPERFRGKRVLLIDDIVTSGATLDECSRTLRKAGAKTVLCATAATAGF